MTVTAAHDFETYAVANLRKTGVDAYAEHPETGVWCMSWKLSTGQRGRWHPGDADPTPFLDHVRAGGIISAFNAPFEAAIWHYVIRRLCPHWPQPRLEQFKCTMARALVLALPASLDKLGAALGLPVLKDKAGHRLMMKMCRPTTAWRKWEKLGGIGTEPKKWHDDPADIKRLGEYCDVDVDVELAAAERMAELPASEREVWLLDQTINRRGIRLDIPAVRAALAVAEVEANRLNAELRAITGGVAKKVTNVKKLLEWLADELFPLDNLKKRTVGTALAQGINNPDVRRVLEIRREASKASVAKLKAMLACVNTDDRARGLLGYHVATTGRWAGRRIQPQNFPRPNLKQKQIEEVLALLPQPGGGDMVRYGYADPLDAIASSLRALIIPAPGRKFVGGDYSNIEGRVIAWLAGEQWKLQAFREYDAGLGPDLYILAYARSFGVDAATITEDDPRRQVGKVQELSLGYQGGPGAFVNMGLNYNIDVSDIAARVHKIADRDQWEWARERYPKDKSKRYGLTEFNWTGLKVVVQAWRDAHPAIVRLWHEAEECSINAIENTGTIYSIQTGLLKFVSNKHFLYCQLPDGKCLAYARPAVDMYTPPGWSRSKKRFTYFGQGKKSKKWEKRNGYGGMTIENATQGTARQRLVAGMKRLERHGYPIVLDVHDDVLAEVRRDFGDPREFNDLLCAPEGWDAGLPVAAKTWTGDRYQK